MDKSRKDNMKKTSKIIILMNLLAVAACATAFGQAVTVTPPLFVETSERKDFIEKGMTQDMVIALIGRPDVVCWDNHEKTMYHAVYKYEIYKCSFTFTMEAPVRGRSFRESNKSDIEAKYAASASIYYYVKNGEWTVYKVVGSTENYNAYRKNNYQPLNRMCEPDDAVLIERY
jgi:hypothetical protein